MCPINLKTKICLATSLKTLRTALVSKTVNRIINIIFNFNKPVSNLEIDANTSDS